MWSLVLSGDGLLRQVPRGDEFEGRLVLNFGDVYKHCRASFFMVA